MLKMGYFLEKNCKYRRSVGGSAPKPLVTDVSLRRLGWKVFVFIYYCNFEILLKLLLVEHNNIDSI